MAPEIIELETYGKVIVLNYYLYNEQPVDIWSIGIVMYILINKGKHAINFNNEVSMKEFLYKIKNIQWDFPKTFSQ